MLSYALCIVFHALNLQVEASVAPIILVFLSIGWLTVGMCVVWLENYFIPTWYSNNPDHPL